MNDVSPYLKQPLRSLREVQIERERAASSRKPSAKTQEQALDTLTRIEELREGSNP